MTIRDIPMWGDGWWPCPCCGGSGGSNAGPLPDHSALVAAAREVCDTVAGYDPAFVPLMVLAKADALRAAIDQFDP